MTDVENGDCALFVVDFVNHTIFADADAPSLTRGELEASGWGGLGQGREWRRACGRRIPPGVLPIPSVRVVK